MVWGWSRTRYSPIAIDFGADSLKLLQIIPSDPPQLVAAGSIDVPEHARTDPAARQAFFGDALKEVLSSSKFKAKRAICSIPAYQTLVQHLKITRSDDPIEIESQINQHLRHRLNVDPSRMVVRHFPVGQVMGEGGAKQEVICFAVSRDAAMGYIQLAHRAKLEVVGMHSEPLAILKAFAHLYRRDSDTERSTCFIDLGGATTKVIIAHGIEMAFAKTIHVGGDYFTRQVAHVSGTSFSDARLTRMHQASGVGNARAHDTPSPDVIGDVRPPRANVGMRAINDDQPMHATAVADQAPDGEQGAATQAVQADFGETLDCLIDELQLSVRYHQSLFPERKIEKLIFLGGESRHVWLCQKIARALRIGAQLGDPLARLVRLNRPTGAIGVDMRQSQPGWAVPMGLCLSEANL